ncbi:Kinesin light chain [Tetrabaena socialis]|uniref:Kinesin light chain n=1 Tax=Tetrabaena socialis TaxID=47790 RepID=A0A2J7ZSW9_9CHLO|nr:Kinesin light chain [Tetrabaena socialis]|eukprot:PNH03366.1 Kinesin light chain [Tetrabaena socialis]
MGSSCSTETHDADKQPSATKTNSGKTSSGKSEKSLMKNFSGKTLVKSFSADVSVRNGGEHRESKGILLKEKQQKLRTLSRVSWHDTGELPGEALPAGVGDEGGGLDAKLEGLSMEAKLEALGQPDPKEVAATLHALKNGHIGNSDGGARAVDVVLAGLSSGASSLSQRAAAIRQELQANEAAIRSKPKVAADLASKLEGVAAAAAEAGKTREALWLCLHAHAIQAESCGDESPEAAHCLVRVGNVLMMLGKLQQAEVLARHAAHRCAQGFGLQHIAAAEGLILVGEVLGLQGRFEESRAHLRCALELYIKSVGRQTVETADIFMRLAGLHQQRALHDEAVRLYRQAFNIRKRVLGPRCMDTIAAAESLAGAMFDKKDYKQSEREYGLLLQLYADMHGGNTCTPGAVVALTKLAAVQAADGRAWEAEATFKRAQTSAIKLHGPDHQLTLMVNLELARLLMGRKDAGEVHLRAAEQLLRTTVARSARVSMPGNKAQAQAAGAAGGGGDVGSTTADGQVAVSFG